MLYIGERARFRIFIPRRVISLKWDKVFYHFILKLIMRKVNKRIRQCASLILSPSGTMELIASSRVGKERMLPKECRAQFAEEEEEVARGGVTGLQQVTRGIT